VSCDACTAALANPLSGLYRAACAECQARALAQSPQFFDAVAAEAITPGYRSALEHAFGSNWKDGHARVKAWAEKLQKGTA
jgi:hypothetical protein